MIIATVKRRDAWIPWTFVGAFLLVVAANAALIFYAFQSWTGLATDNPYERGLSYNREIAAARAQRDAGWRATLTYTESGEGRGVIALDLADGAGRQILGAVVTARIRRPTEARRDFDVTLADRGAGRYAADLTLPLPGLWDVEATARVGGHDFRLDRRIFVR